MGCLCSKDNESTKPAEQTTKPRIDALRLYSEEDNRFDESLASLNASAADVNKAM